MATKKATRKKPARRLVRVLVKRRNPAPVKVRIRPMVTDRALRYRANANPPEGEKRCCLCGSKRNVEVGHVNGHEEDNTTANKFWTCRACNVRSANTLRKAGRGRKTRQYNPREDIYAVGRPAKSLGQWLLAVNSMKGLSEEMSLDDAVAMIRATPAATRSKFAKEIWRKRRAVFGRTGRTPSNKSEVPF